MIKYCPACYTEFETEDLVCPQCGTRLEDPYTEDEQDELLELLMNEILAEAAGAAVACSWGQLFHRFKGILIGHCNDFIVDGGIQNLRHEIGADALDFMRTRLPLR